MIYLVTIALGWVAYVLDYLLIQKIEATGMADPEVLYLYVARSLIYLMCIYFVTRSQMVVEGYLRGLGSKVETGDLQYWYSTLCSYIPHILLPSLIRIFSDALPLIIFIFFVCIKHESIRFLIFSIFSILFIYLVIFYIIQTSWSKKASKVASEVISNLTYINSVERKTVLHSADRKDFLKARKSRHVQNYVNANSAATTFSQTIRYQVELVAVLIIAFNIVNIPESASTFYVLYRLANAGFQMLGILSGIGQYRFYFFQAQKLVPEIRIFGDRVLNMLAGKEK